MHVGRCEERSTGFEGYGTPEVAAIIDLNDNLWAHARDNYRCVISGFLDNDVAVRMDRSGLAHPQGQKVLPATPAHIIPFSIAPNSERQAEVSVFYRHLA